MRCSGGYSWRRVWGTVGMVLQAYRLAPGSTAEQQAMLASHRGAARFAFNRRHVRLPRIGTVRTHESTRKLARHVERGTARQQGPDKRAGQKTSARWRKTQVRIAELRTAIANARADGLHQLSTRLVNEFDAVVLEDLHVAGMLRNRQLARAVPGAGMGGARRQVTYKAAWSHRALIVADRFCPSSKTCDDCGVVTATLSLRQRTFTCDHCGCATDRDLNAARNLASPAETTGSTSSPSCGATQNEPAGNPRKTSPAGTGYRYGKTSTHRAGADAA
ncbi:transposase [Saccharopolyspora lacisalsi]|uniref:Transposase n=1 Tax=Halosaccharopolyspora lacisalsi TaxID=1000566 RepID=A0A839DYJ1_9PSEU|nr:RNA-guided endonuclease TnpB family protein [Halosaccharopolyspora lacisalsi]MBA8825799.1 transposase [Halosaccharopolyspora lacisalsi]